MQIQILHLGYIVLVFHLVVIRLGDCHRVRSIGVNLEQGFAVFRSKHISVTDEPFFQIFALANEEVHATVCRQGFCNVHDPTSQATRQLFIRR